MGAAPVPKFVRSGLLQMFQTFVCNFSWEILVGRKKKVFLHTTLYIFTFGASLEAPKVNKSPGR